MEFGMVERLLVTEDAEEVVTLALTSAIAHFLRDIPITQPIHQFVKMFLLWASVGAISASGVLRDKPDVRSELV